MFDYSKLTGRIIEKYGSRKAFAEALGVHVQTVSAKLLGGLTITPKDIVKWSELLGIARTEIGLYFFTPKV